MITLSLILYNNNNNNNNNKKVTSIAILDSMSQMAIGLENGTVILMNDELEKIFCGRGKNAEKEIFI